MVGCGFLLTQQDEQNFGNTRAQTSDLIAKSFKFWEKEFESAHTLSFPVFGKLQLATQSREERTCTDANDESVDLRFQLGVLTQDQEDYIKSAGQFAAITIRTEYDQVQLKGKGFFYVSPVLGRLAYNGAFERPDFWSAEEGKNFYHVLRHELGHVFGLPHRGSTGELMSEDFADSFQKMPKGAFDNYFSFARDKKYCYGSDPNLTQKPNLFTEVFNITDPRRPCLRFEFIHKFQHGADSEMKVYSTEYADDAGTLIGMATLELSVYTPSSIQFIQLSPQQSVFTHMDLSSMRGSTPTRTLGLVFMKASKKGIYRSLDGKTERIISIRFEQGSPTVSGSYVLDGELWEGAF